MSFKGDYPRDMRAGGIDLANMGPSLCSWIKNTT